MVLESTSCCPSSRKRDGGAGSISAHTATLAMEIKMISSVAPEGRMVLHYPPEPDPIDDEVGPRKG
jgi:hypothetical protein